MSLDNIRIVLVKPQGTWNVGSVARSMKNMGLTDLALVRPRQGRRFWAEAMAVHADDVLEQSKRFDTLQEAIEGCGLVVGTTCRSGPQRRHRRAPRDLASEIVAHSQAQGVAIVFGPEDHGLSNEELKLCNRFLEIPASREYSSLNLAQAVMVCCYEIHLADLGTRRGMTSSLSLAKSERVEFMFERLKSALTAIGFLNEENPEHIMFSLRRILARAGLEERDVRIFLAMARQVEWAARDQTTEDTSSGSLG